MKISDEAYDTDPGGALVLRSSPMKNFMFVIAACAILGATVFFGTRFMVALSPMMILLLSVPMGITALITVAIFAAAIHSFRASLRPSNWSMQIGSQSLVVNLRDYRNAVPGEALPVLRLPIQDISSMVQVTETWIRRSGRKGGERARIKRKFVELTVDGIDTSDLAKVLLHERRRNTQKSSSQKSASPFKFHALHIFVLEPGVVRLVASRRVVSALGHLLTFGEACQVDLDKKLAHEPSLLRAHALDMRGERLHATTMLSKEEGLSFSEARVLLDESTVPGVNLD
ncbi:MAG: hypothetical protein JKY61_08600 [Planctomycetes bacterium]|nr:hypothetical protein [Planctomycetota bacterium]